MRPLTSPIRRARAGLAGLALGAACALGAAQDAVACACCAQAGASRQQERVIDRASVVLLAAVGFPEAALYDGVWRVAGDDGAPEDAEGPPAAQPYPMSVLYNADGWTFTLTGPDGGVGALAFPATTLFERRAIDLAPGESEISETGYYVEWRFRAAVAAIGGLGGLDARPAELVFHGSGDECYDADRLSHFSLTIEPVPGRGARAERLFGALAAADGPAAGGDEPRPEGD